MFWEGKAILELQKDIAGLQTKIHGMCLHKSVKEHWFWGRKTFVCELCEQVFSEKPKGSKIHRVKDVYEDK